MNYKVCYKRNRERTSIIKSTVFKILVLLDNNIIYYLLSNASNDSNPTLALLDNIIIYHLLSNKSVQIRGTVFRSTSEKAFLL